MKTMKIEKQMVFADTVKKVVDLQVKEGLSYHKEREGIRAIGPLFIQGQYEGMDQTIQSFQEVLDMDIMAPAHKLNGEDFFIQVEEFHGIPDQEGMKLYVTMSIHGLIEEQTDVKGEVSKKQIESQTEEKAALNMESTIAPMKEIQEVVHPSMAQEQAQVETVVETKEEAVVEEEGKDTFDEFEDLFDDAGTTYTSYRMIVAKPNDTYTSIAQRYAVEEAALRSSNHDKEISDKTLVILP